MFSKEFMMIQAFLLSWNYLTYNHLIRHFESQLLSGYFAYVQSTCSSIYIVSSLKIEAILYDTFDSFLSCHSAWHSFESVLGTTITITLWLNNTGKTPEERTPNYINISINMFWKDIENVTAETHE